VPELVGSSTGLLFITGGSNGRRPPEAADPTLVSIARETNTVVAELRMVPNQPLVFAGDNIKRTEDSLIAYTWDKYLRTDHEFFLPTLPASTSMT